jgi:beta-glucosidase/6-phospho-beta-glucosidase/beta-galactosidase
LRPSQHEWTRRAARPALVDRELFSSFWGAGFESACHINKAGVRLDMVASTQHDRWVDEDYAALEERGLTTVRETVRWHLVEPSEGRFDFRTLEPMVETAKRHRLQILWTLSHYGWPDGLDLLSASFVGRFSGYCRAVASFLDAEGGSRPPVFTPINEMSFLAWAAGETGWFYPFLTHRGADVKRQLVHACLAGIAAIREVNPCARILTSEPLIHLVAETASEAHVEGAATYRASQFEVSDMLTGRRESALGGDASCVDIVGLNFYHDNQWEYPGGRKLSWHVAPRDARWRPLHLLLQEVFERYQRPLYITETSHVGDGRATWLHELSDEIHVAIDGGVPILGVCLYPIIDRYAWDDPTHWHKSGLWDLSSEPDGRLRRVLNREYAEALAWVQHRGAMAAW